MSTRLEMLQDLFPAWDVDALQAILDTHHDSLERAIDTICTMNDRDISSLNNDYPTIMGMGSAKKKTAAEQGKHEPKHAIIIYRSADVGRKVHMKPYKYVTECNPASGMVLMNWQQATVDDVLDERRDQLSGLTFNIVAHPFVWNLGRHLGPWA